MKTGNLMVNAWSRSFLRHCRAAIRGRVDDPTAVLADIARQGQELFDETMLPLAGKKAHFIAASCSLVLASHRRLSVEIDDPAEVYEFLREIFGQTFRRPFMLMFGTWFRVVWDPIANMSRPGFLRRVKRRYGPLMEFDRESTDDSFDLIVRRCAFHQFFVDHDAPELTPIICAWDRNWMDLVDRSSRRIRTERPTTISTGGDCCRFRFVRDVNKTPAESDDVILVQIGPQK